jgi:DnaK suppressor protein
MRVTSSLEAATPAWRRQPSLKRYVMGIMGHKNVAVFEATPRAATVAHNRSATVRSRVNSQEGVERHSTAELARRTMPLTTEQRTYLERRLKEERALALQTLNRAIDDHAGSTEQDRAGDLTKMPSHLADLGTDTIDEELDASNATRTSNELAEIDAALERLYKSPEQFGRCEDTGRDIPFERLDLIPWARTCDDKNA